MNEPSTARVASLPDLDIRSLRYFVAVAEELHFTRAAARLFVAQQALSREIAGLEHALGVALFVRTTRHVALTPAGETLLRRAREILALHDRAVREVSGAERPIVVDLLSQTAMTGRRVLERARIDAPDVELRGRFGGGLAGALTLLAAGDVDVALGRLGQLGDGLGRGMRATLFRLEPMALLLPAGHPLAAMPEIPMAALRGVEIDAGLGYPASREWHDLSEQLLALSGARSAPPHLPAEGLEEESIHLVRQGLPILTQMDHADAPAGIVRPIVRPTPVYAWSIVCREDAGAGALAVEAAAIELSRLNGWLELPHDPWLPEPEAGRLAGSGRPRPGDAGVQFGRSEPDGALKARAVNCSRNEIETRGRAVQS